MTGPVLPPWLREVPESESSPVVESSVPQAEPPWPPRSSPAAPPELPQRVEVGEDRPREMVRPGPAWNWVFKSKAEFVERWEEQSDGTALGVKRKAHLLQLGVLRGLIPTDISKEVRAALGVEGAAVQAERILAVERNVAASDARSFLRDAMRTPRRVTASPVYTIDMDPASVRTGPKFPRGS